MKKIASIVFSFLIFPLFISPAFAQNGKKLNIQTQQIIKNISYSVLNSRAKGRDEEEFKKDKAALKSLHRSLRKLRHDLIMANIGSVKNLGKRAIGSSSIQLAVKNQNLKKAHKELRKNLFNQTAAELEEVEKDYQIRKMDKKIRKLEQKQNWLKHKQDASSAKVTQQIEKLDQRLGRLKTGEEKVKRTGKPLARSSNVFSPESDGSSRLASIINELQAMAENPNKLSQLKKLDKLIERSGGKGELKKLKARDSQPTTITRTQHRNSSDKGKGAGKK